jgi:protein arginine kinase activator
MICQFCKEREATIHFTNVVGSKVEKIHICPQCAEEKGFDYLKKSNFAMGDLVAGLLDSALADAEGEEGKGRCPNCNRSYEFFKKVGRLGCSICYEHFQDQLIPLLSSIHGNTRHRGKVPKRYRDRVKAGRRILELEEELGRAVTCERYEEAARLRDEIRRLRTTAGLEEGECA